MILPWSDDQMMSRIYIQLRNQVWSSNTCYAWTLNYLTITTKYIYIYNINDFNCTFTQHRISVTLLYSNRTSIFIYFWILYEWLVCRYILIYINCKFRYIIYNQVCKMILSSKWLVLTWHLRNRLTRIILFKRKWFKSRFWCTWSNNWFPLRIYYCF